MKWILVPAALGVLTFTTPIFAQTAEDGFYGGIGMGKSSVEAKPSLYVNYFPGNPGGKPTNSTPFFSDDLAWSAFLGYESTIGFGVELGFWDHGNLISTLSNSRVASIGLKELYLGGTVTFPLVGPLSLTGGLGLSRALFDTSETLPTASLRIAEPDDQTGGYWRVGISARFDRFQAGLSFEHRELRSFNMSSALVALSCSF